MFSILEIVINKDSNIFLTTNISSLMQGVLMENISNKYGEYLHLSQLKPYSQYVIIHKEVIKWYICTTSKEAKEKILNPLMNEKFSVIKLRHKALEMDIISKKMQSVSIDQFINENFLENGRRIVKIKFVSPTAFKSNGEYVFYPSVRYVFQSLAMKFDACSDEFSIFSQQLIEDFTESIKVIQYNLKSVQFHLEGVKIPAFTGEITIKISGTQQMVNLAHMLLKFGEYCGVGIKCAIGMGAICIVQRGATFDTRRI